MTLAGGKARRRLMPSGSGVGLVVVAGVTTGRGGRESRPQGDMLRATYRPLCCAEDYVAYRAEREGASGCLRADRGLWRRRRFRSLSRQRNIFSTGLTSRPSRGGPTMSRSTGLICTARPARNSSDACSIALGRRIAKPGRCRTSRAVRVVREPSTAPKLCCAGKPRSPCNGAHIRAEAT